MSRYLNEGAVWSAVKRIPHITVQTRQAILEALRKVPTADVKEVKHGQWNTVLDESILEHYNNDVDIFACSICGIKSKRPTIFCPSCGARMDGGVKE